MIWREAGGKGELASEIDAEAAAVSGGAGAATVDVGRSSNNVTMRRSIAAEASSGTIGVPLAVTVGSTDMGSTGGCGDAAVGSSAGRRVDANQVKVRMKNNTSRMITKSPNHRIKGKVVAPMEVGEVVVS
mmetsp:Transcript_15728/g.32300  ORF Transcript_15728/g.32300 Transcript_15728/m.32300 type:complete len:130 (+) Transcript_15728:290-679(+)|eukprot:CAMPEP_0201122806 /NCGR_PEP_ID=MMETSP0850-20130426/6352_1 /ASSEMBLY_ACC=CAM_ASM_000622 /TAXON_ID=183588 /ORGANISM="Pseudo-nitzschia fraudulenta, Strain WWA7" /LENGTH=129 /DNA_ID=CAMNT_0047389575 /DNA_START=296 /DNA_END=685 /DNA_ORIENTATION=-